jgi:hypothetical protein
MLLHMFSLTRYPTHLGGFVHRDCISKGNQRFFSRVFLPPDIRSIRVASGSESQHPNVVAPNHSLTSPQAYSNAIDYYARGEKKGDRGRDEEVEMWLEVGVGFKEVFEDLDDVVWLPGPERAFSFEVLWTM